MNEKQEKCTINPSLSTKRLNLIKERISLIIIINNPQTLILINALN